MRALLCGLVAVSCISIPATAVADSRPNLGVERRQRELSDREFADLARALTGKSEAAVVARLGRPDRSCSMGNSGRLIYKFGRSWLVLYIRSGRVFDVGGNERQTGVREDDFAGIGGP
jgi:hypothetical protein